jgi:hypothetical protein
LSISSKKAVKKLSKIDKKLSCQKVVKKLSKNCQKNVKKVVKVVKEFDPTFVLPEPSWSLVDQRPNCLPRKKLVKKKLFFAKKLS